MRTGCKDKSLLPEVTFFASPPATTVGKNLSRGGCSFPDWPAGATTTPFFIQKYTCISQRKFWVVPYQTCLKYECLDFQRKKHLRLKTKQLNSKYKSGYL